MLHNVFLQSQAGVGNNGAKSQWKSDRKIYDGVKFCSYAKPQREMSVAQKLPEH